MQDTVIINRLEESRREKGVSQAEAAKAVHVSRKTMERYESGAVLPRIDMAYRLSLYYEKGINELFLMRESQDASGNTPSEIEKQ